MPDLSTVSWRQKTLRVQLSYRASTTALDLLVDSTGIKFLGEGEWKRKKHGAECRRQWRKVLLGIDAHTLEIRAIEVTDNSVGDAPMLPELLAQIPPDEAVASVSADGAYDTGACQDSCRVHHAVATVLCDTDCKAMLSTASRSGFKATVSMGFQLRVCRDQREGFRSRACRYTA